MRDSGRTPATGSGSRDGPAMTGPADAAGPGEQVPRLRRAISPGRGLAIVALGAILVFALPSGSGHWLNLHTVGVILIVAGALGMILPGRMRGDAAPTAMRRWLMPGQFQTSAGSAAGRQPGADDRSLVREYSEQDPPTLADDILSHKHDPPL
jgi:hypothetical protein